MTFNLWWSQLEIVERKTVINLYEIGRQLCPFFLQILS